MKTLFLHSDYIRYRPVKKALKSIKELNEKDKNETIVKDALVVLISVEKRDSDVDKIAGKLIENIKDVASQVKTKNIVLYPYAHLSSSLAIPDVAENVLSKTEKLLKDSKGFNVSKAPFGYYKEFEIKVKRDLMFQRLRSVITKSLKSK